MPTTLPDQGVEKKNAPKNRTTRSPREIAKPKEQSPRLEPGEATAHPTLLSKEGLRDALNLPTTRMVDEMMRKRRIPYIRLGHKTVRFNLERVLEALSRLEVRAIGD